MKTLKKIKQMKQEIAQAFNFNYKNLKLIIQNINDIILHCENKKFNLILKEDLLNKI